MRFDELGLTPEILNSISQMGFEIPTAVQAQVIPRLLKNKGDMVALAQTGTGKTAAFGLPIINMLDHNNRAAQALVLCPTRELCVQISRDLKAFAAGSTSLNIVAVYGGAPIQGQLKSLSRGVQIIVATPGRMHDILRRKKADLSAVARVVLDEADEMLNMGFHEDLEAILSEVPDSAHTLLFSATMPKQVAAIARKYMKNAEEITIGQRNAGAENVNHECYIVHQKDRYLALKRLADFYPDMYAIVFCRTRQDTQSVANWLIRDGYNADSLHGDLSQAQRDSVMKKFRDKSIQILVATDVAARGLDVNDLTHVINYNLPDDLGSYTHRSGRTGRAGKSGVSVVIINMREKGIIRRIEKMINKTFQYRDVPCGREICEAQLFSLVKRMKAVEVDHEQVDEFLPAILESFQDMGKEDLVKRFVSLEFSNLLKYYRNAVDLSGAAELSKHHQERGEDRSDRSERSGRRSSGKGDRSLGLRREGKTPSGDVRVFINLGKSDGLNAEKLSRLIKQEGEYEQPVKRVDVMKTYSFFEVSSGDVSKLLIKLGSNSYKGRDIRVEPVHDSKESKRMKRSDRRKGANAGAVSSVGMPRRDRRGKSGRSSSAPKKNFRNRGRR